MNQFSPYKFSTLHCHFSCLYWYQIRGCEHYVRITRNWLNVNFDCVIFKLGPRSTYAVFLSNRMVSSIILLSGSLFFLAILWVRNASSDVMCMFLCVSLMQTFKRCYISACYLFATNIVFILLYVHRCLLLKIHHCPGWHKQLLTHWGRVTHICVSVLTTIGSDNDLSPGRRQAIIWTNAGILLIGPLGTNFSKISIKILIFSLKKMRLKVSSVK